MNRRALFIYSTQVWLNIQLKSNFKMVVKEWKQLNNSTCKAGEMGPINGTVDLPIWQGKEGHCDWQAGNGSNSHFNLNWMENSLFYKSSRTRTVNTRAVNISPRVRLPGRQPSGCKHICVNRSRGNGLTGLFINSTWVWTNIDNPTQIQESTK